MNKIVSSLIVGIMMLVATPAIAGGRHDHRWGVDANHHSPYHHVNRHRHGGLNSTEKVIIGAIIGGVFVDAMHRNRPAPEPVVVYAPPPPPQPYPATSRTCTTREVYDQYNRLITRERFCN